jgi:hypothetical protein
LAVNGQQQTDPNYLVADFSTIQLLDKTRWAAYLKKYFSNKTRVYHRIIPKNMLCNSKIGTGLLLTVPGQKNWRKNERTSFFFLRHARLF